MDIPEQIDFDFLKTVLDGINTYNDAVITGTEESAAAIADAYNTAADLALEIMNQKIQIQLDLTEAKKEWEEFASEIKRIWDGTRLDLNFFEDESASEIVDRIIGSKALKNTFGDLETILGNLDAGFNAYRKTHDDKGQDLAENAYELESDTKLKYESAFQKNKELSTKNKNINSDISSFWTNFNSYFSEGAGYANAAISSSIDNAGRISELEGLVRNQDNLVDELEFYSDELDYIRKEKKIFKDAHGYEFDPSMVVREGEGSGKERGDFLSWQAASGQNLEKLADKIEESGYLLNYDLEEEKNTLGNYEAELAGLQSGTDIASNNANKKAKDIVTLVSDLKNKGYNIEDLSLETVTNAIWGTDNTAFDEWLSNNKKVLDEALENSNTELTNFNNNTLQPLTEEYQKASNAASIFDETLYTTQDGFDEAKFKEDISNWLEKARDQYEGLKESLQSLYDAWFSAQEELVQAYEEQIDKLSNINSLVKSQAELWKIVGKNSEYYGAKTASFYNVITRNTNTSYKYALAELEKVKESYNDVINNESASDEMVTKVTENLQAATEKVLSLAQERTTALAEEYGATLTGIIDTYFKEISGLDLAALTEDWSLTKEYDERYLDDVNSAYAISEIERSFQKGIDATDSITAQKKLNTVMQEQLKILREKDKLSQYDVDRANAMYELTLKQIALEEAQQTATKMKLTRDAMGNYSYQYVQDEDAVAKAQEELAAAQNELYNLDKDRQKSLVDDYYSIWSDAQEKIAQAMAEGDTERVARLEEYYFGDNGLISEIKRELGIVNSNFDSIGSSLGGDAWISPFKEFTDAIVNSDLSNLLTDINNLTKESVLEMDNLLNEMLGVFNENSPIMNAVSSLSNSLVGLDEVNIKAEDALSAAETVLDELPDLLLKMDSLAKILSDAGEAYVKFLEDNSLNSEDLMKDNTAALQGLTEELKQARLRVLDEADGKADGVWGEYKIDDEGKYTQNAGE